MVRVREVESSNMHLEIELGEDWDDTHPPPPALQIIRHRRHYDEFLHDEPISLDCLATLESHLAQPYVVLSAPLTIANSICLSYLAK